MMTETTPTQNVSSDGTSVITLAPAEAVEQVSFCR